MQKSIIILIVSGALIGIALILLVLGNQMILEGINQGNGKISQSQSLIISAELDIQETTQGVFAVQIIDFKDNTLTAKILDPLDIEIISQIINEESIEKEFDIVDTGIYKLVIENEGNEEIQVFGAMGPLPDASKKLLGLISVCILIIGMVGMVGFGINGIRNRKKSI
jgi:hypothetical protein